MIIFCPSDAELGEEMQKAKLDTGEWCIGYAHRDGGKCARAVDSSYGYWGYVLDLGDANDPQLPLSTYPVLALLAADAGIDTSIEVNAQLGYALDHIINGEFLLIFGNDDPFGMYKESDTDASAPAEIGNGGGTTIYRLREGIERFLITDINNPAASAQAQSEVYIMFDQLATNPSAYNHIPGGANVLYMDGHVQFVRYEQYGQEPCNEPMAVLAGILTGGV